MVSKAVYTLRPQEVYTELETSPLGLRAEEVVKRQLVYGQNRLKVEAEYSLWQHFLTQIIHPFAILLWIAGLIAFVVGELALGSVIWILVLINAWFSFRREYRVEQAMRALQDVIPNYARVVRDGLEVLISAKEIVPGDLLILAEGDHISADARVVQAFDLRTSNAALLGEALPARKSAEASLIEEMSQLERPNLVFAGTSVVSGTGRAVAYSTGMLTQFGRIAHLTQSIQDEPSLLQAELIRFTRRMMFIALALGVLVFVVSVFDVGLKLSQAFLLSLGVIVAVVPEGLSANLTLSLAMAGQRLAQVGVLLKKLSTLEIIGNVSILCTDKSGTLTQNQMTVCNIWVGGEHYLVSGDGYEPKGNIIKEDRPKSSNGHVDLECFLTAAALCNNARLLPPAPEQSRWGTLGDQTEAALLAMSRKGNVQAEIQHYPRVHELPFDARRKRMSTIHRCQDGQEVAFVKGSPKEVLQICSQIVWQGQLLTLTNALRAQVMAENDHYARQALRVLALARRDLPLKSGSYTVGGVEQNLTFLGLAAMMDPPRPEVARAIAAFRQTGVRMVMVTGDYGLTAESQARRIGMITEPSPQIITGADLEVMDDAQLLEKLGQETIFARMAPEHKLRLVAAFQQRGEVVAVVGDGVNDAPALRKADIGIAMGVAGMDVAREAADIVLTQDNFELIVQAIEEGRAVYDNLRKFMTYIFASNVPELLPFLLTALFNLPLALTVLQILMIDLGTDLLPALALGMEKPEPDILKRPPRKRGQPLLDSTLLIRSFAWLGPLEALLCYAGFSLVYFFNTQPVLVDHSGLSWLVPLFTSHQDLPLLTNSVFLAGVIIAQVGNAFACRSEKGDVRDLDLLSNKPLLAGIIIQILLLVGMIYIKPAAAVLGLTALPPVYWFWLGLFAPVLYALERARKWVFRQVRFMKLGDAQ